MSTINVQCTDQVLAITNSPVIASGGANENYIQFNFCQLWTGYAKVAVFWRDGESYYFRLINANNKCQIPDECLVASGKFHFGVVGVSATDDSLRRTSEILTYKVVSGVVTEIDDPTPAIYQQILSELESLRAFVSEGVEDSEAWAVGKRDGVDVPSTDPAYHNNSKYWAEQASQTAGVVSFNGRSGVVVPASGDYTPEMVGAAASNHTHTPGSIGAAASNHTHSLSDLGAAAASHVHSTNDITSGTFPSARIADSAITTQKINNGAVSRAKLAQYLILASGTDYGTTLPTAGNVGRIFFKKV